MKVIDNILMSHPYDSISPDMPSHSFSDTQFSTHTRDQTRANKCGAEFQNNLFLFLNSLSKFLKICAPRLCYIMSLFVFSFQYLTVTPTIVSASEKKFQRDEIRPMPRVHQARVREGRAAAIPPPPQHCSRRERAGYSQWTAECAW